jgi:hypothetical protein
MKHNASIATIQSSTPKPQTAKEVIAANVKALIEQLEAGHSDALTAYLNAMSRFHDYSFGNILEIARQKPDAVRVACTLTRRDPVRESANPGWLPLVDARSGNFCWRYSRRHDMHLRPPETWLPIAGEL